MSTLYELTGDLLTVQSMAEDPDVDQEMLEATLEGIEAEIEAKAEIYAKVIKGFEADIDAIDKEVKRLSDMKASKKNRIEWLKKHLFDSMKATGKTKFKSGLFSFNIAKNGGKAPLIVDYCPDEFLFHPDPVPDNAKIRELLDSGTECSWARYGERGESLRIK